MTIVLTHRRCRLTAWLVCDRDKTELQCASLRPECSRYSSKISCGSDFAEYSRPLGGSSGIKKDCLTSEFRSIYEFDSFVLDPAEQLLLRDGKAVALQPKAFELLVLFAKRSCQLLDKKEILEELWPGSFVEEGNINVRIHELRRALGGDYFETVPRRGYRFNAAVKVKSLASRAQTIPAIDTSRSYDSRKAIAVLPFSHLGAKPGDEYVSFGLADALITRLSSLSQVTVRPTSSVGKYLDGIKDPVAAGKELKVQSVVHGFIRTIGDRTRVTVQLISVEGGTSLWADKVDQDLSDCFALEDSISEQIANALAVQLRPNQRKRLSTNNVHTAQAYRYSQMGKYLFTKRTSEALTKAVECFEKAIAAESSYASAYSGLAGCYAMLATYRLLPAEQAFSNAKAAVMKAIELDEMMGEAHAVLGHILMYEWDWQGTEREIKRAIALTPNNAEAHRFYSVYLRLQGRLRRRSLRSMKPRR